MIITAVRFSAPFFLGGGSGTSSQKILHFLSFKTLLIVRSTIDATRFLFCCGALFW